ncbi:hypothetical protein HPB47_027689 [Ixodes persulcatus]|uniref:Uncharacterized protein n=1 Tax=Ixodes persulcatus TaxID=34615 RepID=A0AC60PVH5_IXOPE|nr:hypothetical protein HPB47_027689 [Ixodes persulcatus]
MTRRTEFSHDSMPDPTMTRLRRELERVILEQHRTFTTDDVRYSELKIGYYGSRGDCPRHLDRPRHRKRKQRKATGELHYQMSDGDATHILTDPQNSQKVLDVAARLTLKGLLLMGEDAAFTSVSGFSNLDENQFQEVPIGDPENTVVGICYTSGTTGMPKGVEITHRGFVSHLHLGSRNTEGVGRVFATRRSSEVRVGSSGAATLAGGSGVIRPLNVFAHHFGYRQRCRLVGSRQQLPELFPNNVSNDLANAWDTGAKVAARRREGSEVG